MSVSPALSQLSAVSAGQQDPKDPGPWDPGCPFPTGPGIHTCSDALLSPVGADCTPVLFAGPLVLLPTLPPPGCVTLAMLINALSTDFLICEAGPQTLPCLPPKATAGIQ